MMAHFLGYLMQEERKHRRVVNASMDLGEKFFKEYIRNGQDLK